LNARLRWDDIRTGFERPFWVANTSEIFERFSYYAVFATLTLYLHNTLKFPSTSATFLSSIFGGVVWFVPIFGGVVADRIGFRRALCTAYFILTCAYTLVGSIGAPWLAPVRSSMPLGLFVGLIFILPALGIGLVKPSVVGTVARTSKDSVRSIGYSIYYTMVNIGSTFGPIVASWVQSRLPTTDVYFVAAFSVFLMLFVVLAFYREPRAEAAQSKTMAQVARDFGTVLANWRFMLFVVIFSGYWVVYWQQYLVLQLYLPKYAHASDATSALVISVDPLIVIAFTVAINALTRRIATMNAVIIGTVLSSAGWIVIAIAPTVLNAALSLVLVALGEIIQSPRYYEYISRLAPPGQQGTYMGFAFLPIGIGSLIAGWFGGTVFHHYGEVLHEPQYIWPIIIAVGLGTALLLWIYDRALPAAPALQE
jgi:dipeptide/tripeptide permease